jgi:TusA-related sulfurtransferase
MTRLRWFLTVGCMTGTDAEAGPMTMDRAIRRVGEAFVDALARRDLEGLGALVADDVRFRLLLPAGAQGHVGGENTLARFVGWFWEADELRLVASRVQPIAGRLALSYRFHLRDDEGWQAIEQHVVGDVDGQGRLETLDLLCSGFLPLGAGDQGAVHRFDAGDLGCAGGLAAAFRGRIREIPLGDVLVVTARDPAAKQDLPPLARLMGHVVRSVETSADGRLVIAVERGR